MDVERPVRRLAIFQVQDDEYVSGETDHPGNALGLGEREEVANVNSLLQTLGIFDGLPQNVVGKKGFHMCVNNELVIRLDGIPKWGCLVCSGFQGGDWMGDINRMPTWQLKGQQGRFPSESMSGRRAEFGGITMRTTEVGDKKKPCRSLRPSREQGCGTQWEDIVFRSMGEIN